MPKRPSHIPAFNRAELEAINKRLSSIVPTQSRHTIMASLNAAANPQVESPEYGIASLPSERRSLADSSIRDTAAIFAFTNNFEIPFDEQLDFSQSYEEAQTENKALEWAVVLGLLAYFLFPQSEQHTLYDSILKAYVESYRLALKDQAARYGCPNATIGNPPRATLSELKEWAKRDSDSISATYDKDAESQLRKLYDANPLGTISYYIEGMAQWALSRQQQKNLTIGIQNVQAGYQLGLEDFHIRNELETKYAFSGAPPVCRICVRLFSMGHVDFQTMQSNSCPIHPNCPHYWTSVRTYSINCAEIWAGV